MAKAGDASSAKALTHKLRETLSGRSLGVFVAWAGGAAWRRVLLLTLICLALFLPGLMVLQPFDRDEARFAQASKQMMETGDFVDIRFQDADRHKKPVGVYWAQTASAALFGGPEAPIWAYRLPSLLGAILASLLTVWATKPLIGPRAAFIAGAMTAGLLLVNVEARYAKTDALLLASVVAAQGALARLWFGFKDDLAERGWNVLIFWTALAAGVLLKGPIIFLPVIGTLIWVSLTARPRGGRLSAWGRLGWSWGLIWMLVLASPWFIAIAAKTDGGFFAASVGEDMLAKVAQGKEAHGAPPGFYLAAFLGTFWPWTPLALMALPWVWAWRRAPETSFLLGWIIPTWIVFELVATKLPHYVLPTYPAICALAAAALLDGSAKPRGVLFWLGALLWAIPAVALPLAAAVGPTIMEKRLVLEPMILAGVGFIVLLAAWRWLLAGVWIGFLRAALIGAAITYASLLHFAIPSIQALAVSPRMASVAYDMRACADGPGRHTPIASVGYHEPSFVFLTETQVGLLAPETAAELFVGPWSGLVWVEGRKEEAFQNALSDKGGAVRRLAQIEGLNYSNGKEVSMTLYGRADDPAYDRCEARP